MLTLEDYRRIDQFKNIVHKQHFLSGEHDAFRRVVCETLADIFGYRNTIFGYLNFTKARETSLSVLVHNVDQHFLERFYTSGILSKSAYTGRDIVRFSSSENYAKTVLYRDILVPNGYTDFMLCYLSVEGEYIGYLLLFQGKAQKSFTVKDMEILEALRDYIAVEYYNALSITRLYNSVRLLESQSNYYPIGVIIMDGMMTISYANKIAKSYVEDLGISSIKFFSVFYNNYIVPQIRKNLLRVGGQQIVRYKNFVFSIYITNIQSEYYFQAAETSNQKSSSASLASFAPDASTFIYFIKDDLSSYANAGNPYEEFGFTKREQQIAELLRLGKNPEDIALELSISINTVKSHIQKLYQKTNVSSRTEFLFRVGVSGR